MTQLALIIKHKTQPGRRDDVRAVWEKHMAPAVSGNPGHVAYFYCFDNADQDSISAFQVYESAEASKAFLATREYAAYLEDVEPLLLGPPQVTALTPMWSKGSSGAALRQRATPWPLPAGCVRACRQDGVAMRRRGAAFKP